MRRSLVSSTSPASATLAASAAAALCVALAAAPLACGPSMGPAASARPPLATEWLDRAKKSYRAADFDDAREAAAHAIAVAPNDPEARELAGHIALVRLDYAEVLRLTEG